MIKTLAGIRKHIFIYSFICSIFLSGLAYAIPQFKIQTQDLKLEKEIQNTAKEAYIQLSAFLEDSIITPLSIYVAEDEDDFKLNAGSNFPDWGIGVAVPSRNLIILKSPTRYKFVRPFSEVLEHELAHIFLYKKSRDADIPRWMDEGFAMLQSREWRIGLDIIVVRALFTGSVIPLPQIESLNQFDDSKAQLAYVESYLAFSYLLNEYGKESFFELLSQLSTGINLESAFLKTTGSSYTGFQLEFLSYLKKRYNIFALLGDTFLFWLILAFLVIFLYFIKKQRNRKTLKKWEYEDKIGKYGYYEEDQTQD